MGGKIRKTLTALIAVTAAVLMFAQNETEQAEGVVRLMSGKSLQLIEKDGIAYRKAVDATFLHNGTYLICDTALWNVDSKTIRAEGHVQIIQDQTVLSSDSLLYSIDENLARFRGGVVQLQDKDRNTLRTRHLDYNTRDSIAVFRNGGSMRDKDGQIIESMEGEYNSKEKTFLFREKVNMFTDSVFVKTEKLLYESSLQIANFETRVDFWKDDNMLSADRGWYNRGTETFFFEGKVHATSRNQEAWSAQMYYYRTPNDIEMHDAAQIQDTTRNVAALADYIYYCDTLSRVEMRHRAAVAMRTEQDGVVDTLYFGADTIIYNAVKKCDISEQEIADAQGRLTDILTDPVTLYRQKAAKEAAEAAAAAAEQNPGARAKANALKMSGEKKGRAASEAAPAAVKDSPKSDADSLRAGADSLQTGADSLKAGADSLSAAADSVAPLPDTTKIGFLLALRNVKAYRKDIQVKCDSMRYCDLDSIARFYTDPVVWNDSVRQYSSDSLFLLVKGNGLDRASLMSEAMVVTKEDSVHFDQIKSAEILAFFDTTSALKRFDALGGANALFFLRENDALATVNLVETKMLSAEFKNGDIDRIYYFDSPKNDALPVAQMTQDSKSLKGFNWQEDIKPKSKADITTLTLRPSERNSYARHEKTTFRQTDIYFPGYMKSVYRSIAVRDSLARLPKPAKPDTLAVKADTLAARDSLSHPLDSLRAAADSLCAPADSLSAAADSLKASSDSLSAAVDSTLLRPKTARELRREARMAKAKAREEARKKRWEELDARDAEKARIKEEKARSRKRERTRKEILRLRKIQAEDAAKLEKYIRMYEKRKYGKNYGKVN